MGIKRINARLTPKYFPKERLDNVAENPTIIKCINIVDKTWVYLIVVFDYRVDHHEFIPHCQTVNKEL